MAARLTFQSMFLYLLSLEPCITHSKENNYKQNNLHRSPKYEREFLRKLFENHFLREISSPPSGKVNCKIEFDLLNFLRKGKT